MGLPVSSDGREVDHPNHNGLDNRRCNLRVVTHAQNMQNRRANARFSSKYRGVFWHNFRQRWVAQVRFKDRKYARTCVSESHAALVAEELRRALMPYCVEEVALATEFERVMESITETCAIAWEDIEEMRRQAVQTARETCAGLTKPYRLQRMADMGLEPRLVDDIRMANG